MLLMNVKCVCMYMYVLFAGCHDNTAPGDVSEVSISQFREICADDRPV
jgi:hypothetical protein